VQPHSVPMLRPLFIIIFLALTYCCDFCETSYGGAASCNKLLKKIAKVRPNFCKLLLIFAAFAWFILHMWTTIFVVSIYSTVHGLCCILIVKINIFSLLSFSVYYHLWPNNYTLANLAQICIKTSNNLCYQVFFSRHSMCRSRVVG